MIILLEFDDKSIHSNNKNISEKIDLLLIILSSGFIFYQ